MTPALPRTGRTRLASRAALGVGLLTIGLSLSACGDDDSTASPSTSSPTSSSPSEQNSSTTSSEPVVDPGDGGNYHPTVDPANFADTIDNPYLPLTPGSRWVYEGLSDGRAERKEVVVTDQHRTIMGVATVVVRDTVYVDGELHEDTYDWYAQDSDGNVWYFGENTTTYETGQPPDTAGSWEAGVHGALPGIVMPGERSEGDAYRHEYLAGEAEDMAEILEVGTNHTIGLGDYTDVVVTEEWNPLEPEVVEHKYYAPGVGLVYAQRTAGGNDSEELIEH